MNTCQCAQIGRGSYTAQHGFYNRNRIIFPHPLEEKKIICYSFLLVVKSIIILCKQRMIKEI